MSNYAKIIIPFINDNINKIDLTSSSGFVDLYTEDIDFPTNEDEIYLMYDAELRNEYSIDRAKRFLKIPELKRTYIKYINNKAYIIYSFKISQKNKQLYKGIISLDAEKRLKILQFWGTFDSIVDTTLNNNVLVYDTTYTIPPMDYNIDCYSNCKFVITKKG